MIALAKDLVCASGEYGSFIYGCESKPEVPFTSFYHPDAVF